MPGLALDRRLLRWLGVFAVVGLTLAAAQHFADRPPEVRGVATAGDPNWAEYKARFIVAGRVIDTANGDVSHSEGQGFGMLLAVANDDQPAFDDLWHWTQEHLAIRPDGLAAWRWDPAASPPVGDLNNATDGDLLIAWALARAGAQWRDTGYTEAAATIAATIRTTLLRTADDRTFLLPGAVGFEHPDRIVLNPSYMVLPAFAALDAVDPSPTWRALYDTGLALLEEARFGEHQLPPDWLELPASGQSSPRLAAGFEQRYGFEAVRLPLYLSWAGETGALLRPFLDLQGAFATKPFVPAWLDLTSDATAPYAASQGVAAIAALAAGQARLPDLDPAASYYSASLLMLARAAQRDIADAAQ